MTTENAAAVSFAAKQPHTHVAGYSRTERHSCYDFAEERKVQTSTRFWCKTLLEVLCHSTL